jgi:hypothetical protein
MSLWDRIVDPFGTLGKVNDVGTDVWHGISGTPTEDAKRNQAKAMNDQIQAYKEQTELTRSELSRKQGEVAAEKRRVEEKQIRSLRRNRGVSGFLGSGNTVEPGMSDKLGG